MIGEKPIDIEVDGGVTPYTALLVAAAGVNVPVAGSAIFKGAGETEWRANIDALRVAAHPA
jgi:ribulose-phosphate 3-epimerase